MRGEGLRHFRILKPSRGDPDGLPQQTDAESRAANALPQRHGPDFIASVSLLKQHPINSGRCLANKARAKTPDYPAILAWHVLCAMHEESPNACGLCPASSPVTQSAFCRQARFSFNLF